MPMSSAKFIRRGLNWVEKPLSIVTTIVLNRNSLFSVVSCRLSVVGILITDNRQLTTGEESPSTMNRWLHSVCFIAGLLVPAVAQAQLSPEKASATFTV